MTTVATRLAKLEHQKSLGGVKPPQRQPDPRLLEDEEWVQITTEYQERVLACNPTPGDLESVQWWIRFMAEDPLALWLSDAAILREAEILDGIPSSKAFREMQRQRAEAKYFEMQELRRNQNAAVSP